MNSTNFSDIRLSGIKLMTEEQSEFFVKNMLAVFLQIDDMRSHTHGNQTIGTDSPPDRGSPGDRQDGPGTA